VVVKLHAIEDKDDSQKLPLAAKTHCTICKGEIRLFLINEEIGKRSWCISNFGRHFKNQHPPIKSNSIGNTQSTLYDYVDKKFENTKKSSNSQQVQNESKSDNETIDPHHRLECQIPHGKKSEDSLHESFEFIQPKKKSRYNFIEDEDEDSNEVAAVLDVNETRTDNFSGERLTGVLMGDNAPVLDN